MFLVSFWTALLRVFPLYFFIPQEEPVLPWVVYYGEPLSEEAFMDYNPIVLDSFNHTPLKPLLDKKRTILGYLAIAEVEERHSWFSRVREMNFTIEENQNWPGSWSVDLRNPLWSNFLLEELIPKIFEEGFNGLFLDQIDVALALEEKDPEKFKGMREAAVNLIRAIKEKYPQKSLMLNRGYQILPEVGQWIDFELAETLLTSYNFATGEYYFRSESEVEWQMAHLNEARFLFPHLVIFSLDYWDPKDPAMIALIYAMERAQGVRPYVSTILLNEIIPEPKRW